MQNIMRSLCFATLTLLILNTHPTTSRHHHNDDLVVRTSTGRLRGTQFTTIFDHHPAIAFRGIPYARPPIGRLRFLPPVPIARSSGIRDCTNFGHICPQFDPLNRTNLVGNEDCLFLNVYTRSLRPARRQPVMVYIHGGGWFFGSGNDDLQGADLLLNENVVLVTLNYRLGVLGFMSLGTARYSGNQGLKDQQVALRWIKRNVHLFGGDARRVTVFGQSAGSTSAFFHMLAPGSRGLLQQTIQMSFTFDVWSVSERGDNLDEIHKLAARHGVAKNETHADGEDLVRFMQTTDGKVFTRAFPIVQFDPKRVPIRIFSKWLPVVENSKAEQPFLQQLPATLLMSGNFTQGLNVMLGYTTAEALFFVTPDAVHPADLNAFNKRFEIELPSQFFTKNYESEAYKRVAHQIRLKYFTHSGVAVNQDAHTLQMFVKMMSDVYETFAIDRRVRLLGARSTGRTFYYNFALESQFNYYKWLYGAQAQYGAAHADDICYVFHCRNIAQRYANLTADSLEHSLIKTMTGLYANFARFGEPLPGNSGGFKWKPVRPERLEYLNIGMNGLTVGVEPLAEEMSFWRHLLDDNPELMTNDVNRNVDRVLKKYGLDK